MRGTLQIQEIQIYIPSNSVSVPKKLQRIKKKKASSMRKLNKSFNISRSGFLSQRLVHASHTSSRAAHFIFFFFLAAIRAGSSQNVSLGIKLRVKSPSKNMCFSKPRLLSSHLPGYSALAPESPRFLCAENIRRAFARLAVKLLYRYSRPRRRRIFTSGSSEKGPEEAPTSATR